MDRPAVTGFTYQHCGFRVASDLSLPPLAPSPADGRLPDVRVVLVPPQGPRVERATTEFADGRCLIRTRKADLEVSGGDLIQVAPRPRAQPGNLAVLLLSAAWAALLRQRGALPFHGGVVTAGDGAVAFCGSPGAGKSSTAAWLVGQGHALVSDDLSRVEPGRGAATVWPSLPQLRLTAGALASTGLPAGPLGPDHKAWVRPPGPPLEDPLPLRAIYLLQWGPLNLMRLTGFDAVRRLAAAAVYRSDLYGPDLELGRYLSDCRTLAGQVPVWEFTRPRDWSALGGALDTLALSPSRTSG